LTARVVYTTGPSPFLNTYQYLSICDTLGQNMNIISVAPITNLPRPGGQILDYFYSAPLPFGSVVSVPIGRRHAPAIVVGSSELKNKKQAIRRASFSLKGIQNVLYGDPIISKEEFEYIRWVSDYFYSPLGIVLEMFLPEYIFKLKKKVVAYPARPPKKNNSFSFSYTAGPKRFNKYLEKIEFSTKAGQVLVLFPELDAAEKFFNNLPLAIRQNAILWGDWTTKKQEYEARVKLITGLARVVVGTRSAIGAYLPDLSLIILDDDVNDSHKSWDMRPYYDVRPMSIELARRRGVEVVWGGLVPSTQTAHQLGESIANGQMSMVKCKVVDMRVEIKDGNTSTLSRELQKKLSQLKKGKQALLLINRLGEYTVMLCRDCGFVLRCPKCETTLVTRAGGSSLVLFCRRCNHEVRGPNLCPECKGHRFKSLGAGSERVEKEVKTVFPHLRVGRLDSTVRVEQKKFNQTLEDFKNGKIDVLVGTQTIVRPSVISPVSLCAIVSQELSLTLPDYRADEKAFTLTQKFRSMAKDVFLWQTYLPDHRVVKAVKSGNTRLFIGEELNLRKKFSWPPFTQLVRLSPPRRSGGGLLEVKGLVDRLNRVLQKDVVEISELPKSSSIIVKVPLNMSLEDRNLLLAHVPPNWRVDVDPVDTL
jgi:primosomal protein N'